MQLKKALQGQELWRAASEQNASDSFLEIETFLQIDINGSYFLLPISSVKEVSEMIPIRSYPIKIQGHLGIVNMRGSVVPVISTDPKESVDKINSLHRLVFIIGKDEEHFAIVATSIKKVSIPTKSKTSLSLVTVNNMPMQIIAAEDIPKRWENK